MNKEFLNECFGILKKDFVMLTFFGLATIFCMIIMMIFIVGILTIINSGFDPFLTYDHASWREVIIQR